MQRYLNDEFDFLTGEIYDSGIDPEKCRGLCRADIPALHMEDNIFHYTSTGGLPGILMNKHLWFTHIRYLNDRDEVKVGLNIYAQRHAALLEQAKAIHPLAEALPPESSRINTFVCCFSLGNDSLAMWNYYTKDPRSRGYNIGFDYRTLILSLISQNPELAGCVLTFGKVNYCLVETSSNSAAPLDLNEGKNYVDDAIELSRAGLSLLSRESPMTPAQNEAWLQQTEPYRKRLQVHKLKGDRGSFDVCSTMEVIFFMKRTCFADENEFRIAVTVPAEALSRIKESGKYKFRNHDGVLIPYLDLSFDPAAVTSITSSPTHNGELVDKSLRDYCEFCDISLAPEQISHSSIPLRY